jgi:hypothetical protein
MIGKGRMRSPTTLAGILLAAGVMLAGIAAAAPDDKITLSAQEKKIMAAGCTTGLDTATARAVGASRVVASVRCVAHGKEGEVPVARAAQCEKKAGAWKCAPARDVLVMTLYDDSVLALVVEGVRAVEAIQVVNTIADMSMPPFQNGVIDVLQDQCILRQRPERLFKGATHFTLDCVDTTVAVTRDCWDKRCRFFITDTKKRD